MLQRTQSLYLLGVVISSVMIYFFPIAAYSKGEYYELFMTNVLQISPSSLFLMIIMLVLNLTIFIMSLVTLFLYRNRVLQMRVTAFTFLFNALFIGATFWLTDRVAAEYQTFTHYKLGALFPLLSVLFMFFANRAIKKDEAKVRAADRLR